MIPVVDYERNSRLRFETSNYSYINGNNISIIIMIIGCIVLYRRYIIHSRRRHYI